MLAAAKTVSTTAGTTIVGTNMTPPAMADSTTAIPLVDSMMVPLATASATTALRVTNSLIVALQAIAHMTGNAVTVTPQINVMNTTHPIANKTRLVLPYLPIVDTMIRFLPIAATFPSPDNNAMVAATTTIFRRRPISGKSLRLGKL